jgi:hypothetical protein
MISSEVQRTLVKSPPELWAELSDPATLARHLGELGEIRITCIDPERTVEWEAEDTSGTVLIKPSGWGTKVTLTVVREISQPKQQLEPETPAEAQPPAGARMEPAVAPERQLEPESPAEAEPPAGAGLEPAVEPEPEPQPKLAAAAEEASEPEPGLVPRRSFFARLFRRRQTKRELQPEPPREVATPEPVAEQPEAVAIDEDVVDVPEAESPDVSAQLQAAEEVAAEQVTAVLTSVLDRLGAAHHRPFSRA